MRTGEKNNPLAAQKILRVAIAMMAFGITGCHKAETAAPVPPTVVQTAPAAPADPQAPAAPATVPMAGVAARADDSLHQNINGEANPFLTQQLHIFVQQKGRLPQSFTELANTRLDSIPRPPTGKKWAIDSATTEVKAMDAQ